MRAFDWRVNYGIRGKFFFEFSLVIIEPGKKGLVKITRKNKENSSHFRNNPIRLKIEIISRNIRLSFDILIKSIGSQDCPITKFMKKFSNINHFNNNGQFELKLILYYFGKLFFPNNFVISQKNIRSFIFYLQVINLNLIIFGP